MRRRTQKTLAEAIDVRTKVAMLGVLRATVAIVKDYVLGSVLFAVVVLLSFAIGRGRMAASFSFASVSYTHLDVYKRQIWATALWRGGDFDFYDLRQTPRC